MNIYKRKQISLSGHLTSPFDKNLELRIFINVALKNSVTILFLNLDKNDLTLQSSS